MFFRVEFSTYDPELIDILTRAKGKKPYLVEKALTHFLATQAGKETVNALLKEKEGKAVTRITSKKVKEKKVKATPSKEAKIEKKIFIDKFL